MLYFLFGKVASPIYKKSTVILYANPDTQTQQLVGQSDQQTISVLLEKYGDSLYGIAYQKLQSEELAAAAVERTFIIVWQQLSNFDSVKTSIFRWILNIMHRIMATSEFRFAVV